MENKVNNTCRMHQDTGKDQILTLEELTTLIKDIEMRITDLEEVVLYQDSHDQWGTTDSVEEYE